MNTELPIRRVRLYQHGLGYFEHQGRITGQQALSLTIQTTALEDVLRTISVVDLDGGAILGLEFPSEHSRQRLLEWNGLELDEQKPWQGLPEALLGQVVELESAPYTGQGQILGVQEAEREQEILAYLSLQTAQGIRRIDLNQVTSLRPLKAETLQQLQQWLALQAGQKADQLRRISFDAKGEGERRVSFSYTQPHPTWRIGYRLFLAEPEQASLQGWALIENPSPEDWQQVELTLVSGKARRAKQTLQSAPPVMMASQGEPIERKNLNTRTTKFRAGGMFDGGGLDSALDDLFGEPFDSVEVASAKQAVESMAVSAVQDIHIEYALAEPASLTAGQSALLPVLTATLPVKRVVSVYAQRSGAYPQAAVELQNNTSLTLDGGPVVVLDQGQYLGEGDFNQLAPGKKILIEYGDERRVEVYQAYQHQLIRSLSLIKVNQGNLQLVWQERCISRIEVRSRLNEAVELVLIHPCRRDQVLESLTELKSNQEGENIQIYDQLAAGEQRQYQIILSSTLSQNQDVTQFHNAQFEALTSDQQKALREILRGLWQRQNKIRSIEQSLKQAQSKTEEFYKHQQRLNTNLKAVEKQSEAKNLRQSYFEQLSALDADSLKLAKEIKQHQQELELAKRELQTYLEHLTVERQFAVSGF